MGSENRDCLESGASPSVTYSAPSSASACIAASTSSSDVPFGAPCPRTICSMSHPLRAGTGDATRYETAVSFRAATKMRRSRVSAIVSVSMRKCSGGSPSPSSHSCSRRSSTGFFSARSALHRRHDHTLVSRAIELCAQRGAPRDDLAPSGADPSLAARRARRSRALRRGQASPRAARQRRNSRRDRRSCARSSRTRPPPRADARVRTPARPRPLALRSGARSRSRRLRGRKTSARFLD